MAYNKWLDFSTAVIVAHATGTITAIALPKLSVFKDAKQSVH